MIKTEIDELTAELNQVLTLKVSAMESEVRRNTTDRCFKAMTIIKSFPHIQLLIAERKMIEAIKELRIAYQECEEDNLGLYIAKKATDAWWSLKVAK